jgi:hypothetical protein
MTHEDAVKAVNAWFEAVTDHMDRLDVEQPNLTADERREERFQRLDGWAGAYGLDLSDDHGEPLA